MSTRELCFFATLRNFWYFSLSWHYSLLKHIQNEVQFLVSTGALHSLPHLILILINRIDIISRGSIIAMLPNGHELSSPRAGKFRNSTKRLGWCPGLCECGVSSLCRPQGGRVATWRCPWWVCCCSVAKSYPTLCRPMDGCTPGLPILHCLPGFAQVHIHWVGDAIQPSHQLKIKKYLCVNQD